MRTCFIAMAAALLISSCSSAGPYGHTRIYAPLPDEADAAEPARDYDPVMADRSPEQWAKTPVRLFGVVTHGAAQPDGSTLVELSVRRAVDRNLCETAAEDSCRVTVTQREFGTLQAIVRMRAEEQSGEEALRAGSLLRLVGMLRRDDSGRVQLRETYHRHWPRGYYVTTAARDVMRR